MIPSEITLLQLKREVLICYGDGKQYHLPCHSLRQNSPSALQRHQPKPISPMVNITAIEPVGQYAVKFHFDDGHNSGIFSWDLLWQLCQHGTKNSKT